MRERRSPSQSDRPYAVGNHMREDGLRKQGTVGEERQLNGQSGIQPRSSFKNYQRGGHQEEEFGESMMRGGYSQRNTKSSIRGGGFAGKKYPSDRALQEIGIRDSNGQGRHTPRGGFPKP